MSKTLSKLIEKAERTGSAHINGRYDGNYGSIITEKYSITIDKNNILYLKHWGTTTLTLDLNTNSLLQFYGFSVSDRDSMNYIVKHYNIPVYFRYLPSKDQFLMLSKEDV